MKGKNYARIVGSGSYLPSRVVTNAELEKEFGLSNGWIERRTGITQRHWSSECEDVFTMAANAAESALKSSGFQDFDTLIVGRSRNPETKSLTIAGVVHDLLKKRGYELNRVEYVDGLYICSGSVSAINEAWLRIVTGQSKLSLIVASSRASKYCKREHPETACIWGDGAGAFVVAASESQGVIQYQGMGIPEAWDCFPTEKTADGDIYVKMDGLRVYGSIIKNVPPFVMKTVEEAGYSLNDIDWFILHQANKRMIKKVMERLGQSMEKCLLTVETYGNTSVASVLITYDVNRKSGKIKEGNLCALIGFGAGLHMNCMLYRV